MKNNNKSTTRTPAKHVARRTSRKTILVLLIVMVFLFALSNTIKAVITAPVYHVVCLAVGFLTALAIIARWRKTTISELFRCIVSFLKEEDDEAEEAEEGKEAENHAPIVGTNTEEGKVYLKDKHENIISRPIPKPGEYYDLDLNLVVPPKTLEERVAALEAENKELKDKLNLLFDAIKKEKR